MDEQLTLLKRRLAGGDGSARAPLQRCLLRADRPLDEAWEGLRIVLDLSPSDPRLTEEGQQRLREDLIHLDPERVLAHFPRDKKGLLPLKERTAVLEAYGCGETLSRGRALWLAVRSPKRRKDPQALTVFLAPLIGDNHAHRWDQARWLWDARASHDSRSDPPLAAECRSLQDAGELLGALALCGVEVDPDLQRLVTRDAVNTAPIPWGMSSWRAVVERALAVCAPWRFESLLVQRAERWLAGGKKRRPKAPSLRLFALPEQDQQSKTCLMLAATEKSGHGPRLCLEDTSINDRLPEVDWRRSDTPPFSPVWVA